MESKKFLVQIENDDDIMVTLMNASQIIERIDAQDYTYENLCVFDVSEYGKTKPLTICGPWYYDKDPLRITLNDEDGNIIINGYGTDH